MAQSKYGKSAYEIEKSVYSQSCRTAGQACFCFKAGPPITLAQGPLLTASGGFQLEEGEGGSQAAGPQDPALLGKTERGELLKGNLAKPFPLPAHHSLAYDHVCMLSLQSCLTLCDPMDRGPPGSSDHGTLQAGTLEWVAIPFSRRSS